MLEDFILLDANKKALLSINELFNQQVSVNAGDRSRRNQLIVHSTKSGSTAVGRGHDEVQSLTFTNPLAMNLTDYNEVLALIDLTMFVQFKGLNKEFDGWQPCSVVRAGMEWAPGNFLIGGVFTLELVLLAPHFDNWDSASFHPHFDREPAKRVEVAVEVPLMPASFSITLQAHQPNGFFELGLKDAGQVISFSDMIGFGKDYYLITIDSQSNTIQALSSGGEMIDVANFVTGGAPFLLPSGSCVLQVRSDALISVVNVLVRRRWRV